MTARLFPLLRRPQALPTFALVVATAASPAARAEAPVTATQPTAVVPVDETAAEANDSVTQELIEILSKRGLLTKDDAESLVGKLRTQAAKRVAARNAAAAAPDASAAAPASPASSDTASTTADAPQSAAKKPPVRVIYLPEADRKRLRDEVKQEVVEQAKAENWALPNALPEWTKRITLGGDFRFRYERDLFDSSNSPFFINFNAINSGSPYDVSQNNVNLPPLLNTTQDRSLPRIRARLDIDAKLSDDIHADIRLATGNTNNPVSTNQTLGGSFNKYSFVLDRAYLDYKPLNGLDLSIGRIGNPWVSTQLIWYTDLGFDGVTGHFEHKLGAFTPFITAGAYSVENTTFDFPSTQSGKVASRDKWLYAAQLGSRIRFTGVETTVAAAFYDFNHLQGKLSSPCTPLSAADACDTDISRPGFDQKGNTQFALRNLVPNPGNPNGPQYQYFGLASPFRELDLIARTDFQLGGPLHLLLDADFVRNLAYKRSQVLALVPVNNYGAGGSYAGGANGYFAQLLVGFPVIARRGEWNLGAGYRRIESDAVADAFNDPDFYLGGTNAKGYHVIGAFGLAENVWLQGKLFSGTEVTGAPLAIDVIQLDLNARF